MAKIKDIILWMAFAVLFAILPIAIAWGLFVYLISVNFWGKFAFRKENVNYFAKSETYKSRKIKIMFWENISKFDG